MQAHVRHFQHVAAAQRIPGVHDAVLAKCHIDAGGQQLGHARHAPALGVAVMSALQGDIDQRVGHHLQIGLGHERNEFADVVVVHAVHGCEVRAGDAPLQAQALRLIGQGFDVARVRVVGFVAVHVHAQAAFGGQLTQKLDAQGPVGHGAFEVWNTAHHIHTPVQRALERVHVLLRPGLAPQYAVLRKRDHLHIHIRCDAAFHFEQRVHGQQARVAHIHVRADGQQAFGHGPVAIRQGAFHQRLLGE